MTMPGGLRPRLACGFVRDPAMLFLVAVAVLGGGLVLARGAADGVRLLPDSIDYIAAARNLVAGEGLGRLPDGQPYDLWPPLYPVLLAVGGFFVADPHDVAAPLNAVVFGLTVFVAGRWLRQRIRSRFLFVWGCLALALALPLTHLASWAVSEPPFILFALLALFRAEAHLRDGGRSSLAWAVLFTALACLARYPGVAVLVAVAAALLLQRGRPPGERLKRAVLYAVPAFIPLGFWLARNGFVFGEAVVNPGRHAGYSPGGILFDLWAHAGKWAALVDSDTWGRVVVAVLALAICAAVYVIRKRRWLDGWRPFAVLGGFTLAFVVLLIASGLLGNFWRLWERYLSPAYIPLLLMLLLLMDALWARAAASLPERLCPPPLARIRGAWAPGGRALALAALVLCLWIGYGAKLNVDDIRRANDPYADPWDYGSGWWEDSRTLRQLVPDASRRAFSNHYLAVYLHREGFAGYGALPPRIEKVAEGKANGDSIVWFHWDGGMGWPWGAADLRGVANLETVFEADDGIILRVNDEAGDGAAD